MADDREMVWRDTAIETVRRVREAALDRQGTETVPLDCITQRSLATTIEATEDIPARDQATMDGYALDATDDYPLTVRQGEIYPETEPPSIKRGEAIKIATGASLPPGANAVLKREKAEVSGGELTGVDIEPGTYTYERGSNVRAGEQLFDAGERLSAKDAVLLSDLGHTNVEVIKRFSVGVLATGTEICEGRKRDLDSPMLSNLVRSWGHEATIEGAVPDDYDRVRDTIAELADEYDVVLTTGGTSVGHKDYVIRALADLGEITFHRVRIRPGKPIALADLGDTVVFAIPGKPLGAYTVSALVVRPFFTGRMDLPSLEATLDHDVALGRDGFEYAIPVTLDGDEATALGHVNSSLQVYEETFNGSVLSSCTRVTRADGFVLARSDLETGETVTVVPYPTLE